MDYKSLSNEELLAVLKQTPDFDKLVFPNDWYSKFELPEKKCLNPKEFIQESPWLKRMTYRYEPKIVDIAAKPGGLRPLLPAPEAPAMTIVKNSFSDATLGDGLAEPTDQTETSDQPTIRVLSDDSTTTSETKSQPLTG